MFHFLFSMNNGRTEGTKKAPTMQRSEPREKPIRFPHGQVNRVTRIGAFPGLHPKKQPWVGATAAELTDVSSGQGHRPKQVGLTWESKARRCPPLFCRVPNTARTFRGPKSSPQTTRTSDPLKWSWSLTALPRFGKPSARRIAGQVIGQGRCEPGQASKQWQTVCCSPLSGKRSYARGRYNPIQPHHTQGRD